MPAKILKDLHLYENTDQLQRAAFQPVDARMLGQKKLLNSAVRLFDEAKLRESEGDEERAYVYYMRSVNTFQASRKAKDFDSKDQKFWQDMGGKNMPIALKKAESLFQSLQRRYELKRNLAEADRVESIVPSSSLQFGSAVVDTKEDKESNAQVAEPKASITTSELYNELQKSQPSVLILDTRDRVAYNSSHIKTAHCANVPLKEIHECYTANQFEQQLPIADRTSFRQRHNYDCIVLLDTNTEDAGKAFEPGCALRILKAAICEYDNRPVKQPPVLLVGGYESWYLHYPSLCTNAATYQPSEYDFSGKNVERYISESFSYPMDALMAHLEAKEVAIALDIAQPPSVPHIPDRKTKPVFMKPSSNHEEIADIGDYVQLQIPTDSDLSTTKKPADETQEIFDKTVSAHIDLRDRLDSIGEKFRTVHAENEMKEMEESKPAPIPLPDRAVKPSYDAQVGDKGEMKENDQSEMKENVETATGNNQNEPPQPLVMVPDRSTKPNFSRNYAPSNNGTVSESMKGGRRTSGEEDGEDVSPSKEPVRGQVPDRSTKPNPNPGDFEPKKMEQLESRFYTETVRRTQGLEGRVAPGLSGLKNLGNSCYMNSTVQCLSNIQPFSNYFIHGRYRKDINYYNPLGSRGEVARNYAALLGALWEGRLKYIFPYQFKKAIGTVAPVFAGYDQQDAQEFMVFLLDGLHEDLNLVRERKPVPEQNNEGLKDEDAARRAWSNHVKVNSSIIVNTFQGQYLSVVKCRTCLRESRTFDVFMYLSLPIPNDRKCRLEDCIEKFLAPEDITGDCKWLCPHCKQKRDAVKRIFIWKLPKVLIIHLNRFSCNGRWREKLQTNVDFPTNRFDMTQYCCTPAASYYTLAGVVNHYGTMESGHYIAYSKNALDNRWYKFDDHEVSAMSQGAVKTPAAYILYYIAEDYQAELPR